MGGRTIQDDVDHRKNNTLAILLPKREVYSECFIRVQIDALQPAYILHGGANHDNGYA